MEREAIASERRSSSDGEDAATISFGLIDPAAIANIGGPTIHERMGKLGVYFGAAGRRTLQLGRSVRFCLPLGAATWPPHILKGSRRARGKFPVFRSLWAISSLLAGITLLMGPTAAEAFDPRLPIAAPQASEGCCGMDQDDTFRGYTVELWDEAPTVSELNCPDQDEACLLSEADRISRVYRLQQALVERAALERSRHFSKEPLGAGLFQ